MNVEGGLLLLDTPGILWPKFDDPQVGLMLAYTGAVKENVLDMEDLASRLMALLWERYPEALKNRYGIEDPEDTTGYGLLAEAGREAGLPDGPGRDQHRADGKGAAGRIPQRQAGPLYLGGTKL